MRQPPPGCVHHGDRGSQYAAEKYRDRLCEAKLVGSMGRRGNPYDNAKMESLMKTLKVEGVYPLEFETAKDVRNSSRSLLTSTTPGDFTRRLAISAPNSTKGNTPGRWSKTSPDPARPNGPTPKNGDNFAQFLF